MKKLSEIKTLPELISFLEEKFPQSDEPILGNGGAGVTGQKSGCGCTSPHTQSDEPKTATEATMDLKNEIAKQQMARRTPHWESDYAAIWDRFNNKQLSSVDVRQDILELICKITK